MAIPLHSLVDVWTTRIAAANEARKPFMETAGICRGFFSGSVDYMWQRSFMTRYMSGLEAPKFQITIAKAFELVSVVGPSLMWENPGRVVKSHDKLIVEPECFGDVNDPAAQQAYMEYLEESDRDRKINKTRNSLMQNYLNYSQREQPMGGLRNASYIAIVEALVAGRGCLYPQTYTFPGSQDVLTGCFRDSVDNLFIDPDCRNADLSDCKWMTRRHEDKYWDVERRFGWKRGSLKKYATAESVDSNVANSGAEGAMWRRAGKTADVIVWYEVFSKCGAGTRLDPILAQYHDAFEQILGDFAYICVVKGMPCPLNLSHDFIESEQTTEDDILRVMDWPVPYYRDGRWPVAILDFYVQPNDPWPMAPLAMGLGELIFLNVIISTLCDRVYRDSLNKTAILKDAGEEAITKLLSYQHEVIEMNPNIAKNINDLVSNIRRDGVNSDVLAMIEYISSSFDKRTGLMDMMYGLHPGGKVTRVAADAAVQGEAVSVRPDWMRRRVEEWQTEAANLERIAAGGNVKGKTLKGLFLSAYTLWDDLIANEDPVVYVREMRATIEANSIKKPNKVRDNENLKAMSGYMLPVLQWYASTTGNVEPLNGYFASMGDAMEQNVDEWLMPPIQPPQPNPEEEAMRQQEIQMQQEELAAKLQGRQLKNDKLAHDLIEKGAGLPPEALEGMDLI